MFKTKKILKIGAILLAIGLVISIATVDKVVVGKIYNPSPTAAETDPVYSGDPAFGIAAGDITNWDNSYGWGNHGTSTANYLAYWLDGTTLTGLASSTAGYVLTATGTAPFFEWAAVSGGISSGGSSTDHAIVRWDGTGGDTLQDSGITIGDTNILTTSGVIQGTTGSAGAPMFSFSGDPNSGIYQSSGDRVQISTGGSERLRIDGFSVKPMVVLQLPDGNRSGTSFRWGGSAGSGMYQRATNEIVWATNGADRIVVGAGGNIGFGLENNIDASVPFQVGTGASQFGGTVTIQNLLTVLQTASSTLAIGDATHTGCIVMGDSDGAGVSYLYTLDGVLTATSTKPAFCQ